MKCHKIEKAACYFPPPKVMYSDCLFNSLNLEYSQITIMYDKENHPILTLNQSITCPV